MRFDGEDPSDRPPGGRPRPATYLAEDRPHWSNFAVPLLLLTVTVAAPWAFGGVDATRFFWPPIFLGVLCWTFALGARNAPAPVVPWALVPLVAAAGWCLLQLVPLPGSWLQTLSPAAFDYWSDAFAIAAADDRSTPALHAPLSLFPEAGRLQLTWLALGIATYVLALHYLRGHEEYKVLFVAAALVGAGLAVFAVVQNARWHGKLYGFVEIASGIRPFGPFVNRNHGAAFLNLCLPAAIGFFFWLALRSRRLSGPGEWHEESTPWLMPFRDLHAGNVLALACVACILLGIVASMSRGGLASLFAGAAAAFLALLTRRGGLGGKLFDVRALVAAAVLLAASLGFVYVAGFNEKIFDRFATLSDEAEGGRMARSRHWGNMGRAVRDFWKTGSGLGSYVGVHQPYTPNNYGIVHEHADNTYLEALVETGVVGLACVVAFVLLSARAIHILLRRDRDPFGRLFAGCAAFVLASQTVHAFVDFPLYSPANLLLFALWMGGACGRACRLTGENPAGKRYRAVLTPIGRWTGSAAAVAAVALVAAGWAWREAYVQETLAWQVREHRRVAANESTPISVADNWVEHWHSVAAQHPQSSIVQRQLAERWIDRCRVEARDALLAKQPALDRQRVWLATDLNALHAQVMSAARLKRQDELEGIRTAPAVARNLHHAKECLLAACLLDPLNAAPRLRLAQLGFLFPSAQSRERLTTAAARLAPGDADVQFRVGELEFLADRPQQVAKAWRQSLTLSPRHLSAVYWYSVNWLGLSGMLQTIVPSDARVLVALAESQFAGPKDKANRDVVLKRANEVFSQTGLPLAQRHELAGRIAMGLEDYATAESHFLLAIAADGRNAEYRHRLSVAYEMQNKFGLAAEAATAAAMLARTQATYVNRAAELRRRVEAERSETPTKSR